MAHNQLSRIILLDHISSFLEDAVAFSQVNRVWRETIEDYANGYWNRQELRKMIKKGWLLGVKRTIAIATAIATSTDSSLDMTEMFCIAAEAKKINVAKFFCWKGIDLHHPTFNPYISVINNDLLELLLLLPHDKERYRGSRNPAPHKCFRHALKQAGIAWSPDMSHLGSDPSDQSRDDVAKIAACNLSFRAILIRVAFGCFSIKDMSDQRLYECLRDLLETHRTGEMECRRVRLVNTYSYERICHGTFFDEDTMTLYRTYTKEHGFMW